MTFAAGFVLCAVAAGLIKVVAEWISIGRAIDRLTLSDDRVFKNVDQGVRDANRQPQEAPPRTCVVLQFNAGAARFQAFKARQAKSGRTVVDLGGADVAARQSS